MKKMLVAMVLAAGLVFGYGVSDSHALLDNVHNNYEITNEGGQGGQGGQAEATSTSSTTQDQTLNNTNDLSNQNNQDQNQNQNQNQEQDQNQGQAQGMSLEDVGNIKDSFNSQSRRGFHIAPEMTYPGMPGYFVKPTKGAFFQSIEDILAYSKTLGEKQVAAMAKGADVEVISIKLANDGDDVGAKLDKNVEREYRHVTFVHSQEEAFELHKKYRVWGYSTALSKKKATSPQVLGKLSQDALNMTGEINEVVIHIQNEGAQREMTSDGWGIGFHQSNASISHSQNHSSVASGGTGYSTGSAEYFDKPWIQAIILVPTSELCQDGEVCYPFTE